MSGRNIEVRLAVYDADGAEIHEAVVSAAGQLILVCTVLINPSASKMVRLG
jgi:hypothetical protein